MRNVLQKHWPIFFIVLVIIAIYILNYKPNTFLTGWDNLHPEFNFPLNLQRGFFAAWQEYQGLGLVGGMGHATSLIHTVSLLILSIIFPLNMLRYTWTILTLLIGTLGAYFLINEYQKQMITNSVKKEISLLGALFYLLNLSTVQSFYVPYEAFSAHFAALPFLLYLIIKFYDYPSKKNLLLFLLVSFLTTIQSYVPTLFVVYLLTISILLCTFLAREFNKKSFIKILTIYITTIIANAFWLLPFLYFVLTNSHVAVEAKINQMATPTIFQQNKEFGTIQDVVLLKGFWFNNTDLNLQQHFGFMLEPWKTYFTSIPIIITGILFFLIILFGFIKSLIMKQKLSLAFSFLFIFSFTMLATATLPFSWIDSLFREIPLFSEVFRFPFTKFSILASLIYAVLFSVGISDITEFLSNFIRQHHVGKIRTGSIISYSITLILLIVFTFPIFQGHLFYEKEQIAIPQQYFQLFDFFKQQDPNTRIANFPQYTFWGWNNYRFGYGGSGFLWYGIEQPILDRASDVWSKTDENYYFELSNALYSKNPTMLNNVLEKYQINWLLVDKNIINPSSPASLFFPELDSMIQDIPTIHKSATFGNIVVYRVNLNTSPNKYLFLTHDLQKVNSYNWNNYDQAFIDLGNYIADDTANEYLYPFRSLLSNKEQNDLAFNLKENNDSLEIAVPFKNNKNSYLHIPSYNITEDILPVSLYSKTLANNQIAITMVIKTPEVSIEGKKIWGDSLEQTVFTVDNNTPLNINKLNQFPLDLNVNGASHFSVQSTDAYLGTSFLTLKQNNIVTLTDANSKIIGAIVLQATNLNSLPLLKEQDIKIPDSFSSGTISITIPKINDSYASYISTNSNSYINKNCDTFRNGTSSVVLNADNSIAMSTNNATICVGYDAQRLSHREAYAIVINNQNNAGRNLHFWLLNETEKNSPIDTFLTSDKTKKTNIFILPPQDPYGRSYSLHFDNISIGPDTTNNTLISSALYPIPYNFITSLVFENKQAIVSTKSSVDLETSHPNESYYLTKITPLKENETDFEQSILVLSQSFDFGWKAYTIENPNSITGSLPFLFGHELQTHYKINNWENGWVINRQHDTSIIIIFLPQYLEYLGFILLFLLSFRITILYITKNKK